MPDIQEGLEIDGQPVQTYEEGDVNTQQGFQDAIARAVSGETDEEPSEQPRDAQGRFVAQTEAPSEEAPPSEETPDEEAPDEEELEPEDASEWRVRYEEQQKVMGRMGEELGALRQWAQAQQAPSPEPEGIYDIEGMVNEHGGAEVVEWATKASPQHIDEAARAWALSGDPEGAVFYADYRAEQARLEYQAEQRGQQAAPDPALTYLANERKLAEVFSEYRVNDPQWSSYEAGLAPALESPSTPQEIKEMILRSGNSEHMRAGVNFLKPYAQLAVMNADPAQQSPQPDQAAEEARKEAVRRTAIVSGSQRLSDVGEQPSSGELTSEQRIARFKEAFEETSSTDIASGLTINGKPVIPPRQQRS
jgi:hypothetical protein